MCLIIDRNIHPDLKPIKAKTDIVVWKSLLANNRSMVMNFEYHRGQTYSVESMMVEGYAHSIIIPPAVRKAFHAYIKKNNAAAAIFTASKSLARKFIIPAGSLVYYGTNGDICSDRIRFPHTARSAIKAWRSRRPKE